MKIKLKHWRYSSRNNFVSAIVTVVLLLIGNPLGSAQGFVNLDFEDADLTNPGLFVPFTDALPGWSGYVGPNQTTQAMYNAVSLGSALISLISTNAWYNQGINVIDGNFTAVLCSGEDPNHQYVPHTSVAIAQTSLVPVGTHSVIFSLGSASYLAALNVTFNGHPLGLIPLFAGSNYEDYGADVSAYAGTTGELRFTEQPIGNGFNYAYLDDIYFDSMTVPEPSEFALTALGALLLGFRRQRNSFIRQ